MARAGETDWKKLKKEYITTRISKQKLADKYNLTRTSVARHAKKEGWDELRQQHDMKCTQNVIEKSAALQAERLMRYGEIAGLSMDAAVKDLQDPEFYHYHTGTELTGDGMSEIVTRNLGVFNAKLYSDMAAATERFVKIFRSIYGLPTAQEAEAMRIAAERLEMEKKRAAAEQVDEGIQVVISGEAEEWAK